jgi:hypothetical protein
LGLFYLQKEMKMKTLFSCTLIFLFANCFAQQEGSYIITLEGEKIIIADDKAEMSEDHISFNSVDKKNQYMKQSNIQLLVLARDNSSVYRSMVVIRVCGSRS